MDPISFHAGVQPQGLERLCTLALAAADFESAFRYADRRCRIRPLPKSHHYALRAEALARLGDMEGAVKDVETALALSPDDVAANRRLLAWGDSTQRTKAAHTLLRLEDDAATLIEALNVRRKDGVSAAGAFRWLDDELSGWAVWQRGPLIVRLKGDEDETSFEVASDTDHPLSAVDFANTAGFRVPASALHGKKLISLETDDGQFLSTSIPQMASAGFSKLTRVLPGSDGITVIVPVYKNLEATRACLTGVAREIRGNLDRRVIIVDDATPEPRLARLVRSYAGKPGFRVLINEANLGFVGSVNRALGEAVADNIILLNSDTIVTPGFMDRMMAIAKANPDVGTITPLSNNGEFTSFPEPFVANELASPSRIREIDAIAARENAGRLVDLPNGIGFCMFITRRCLDAVGGLSHAYERGYLEDVDFCLRARERGFRNVCAPSIYIGHHGSQSFGSDKRALVMRNVPIVEQKFPEYRRTCAQFMSADPLQKARAAIELKLDPRNRYDRLLVSGSGLLLDVARERAGALLKAGCTVLIAVLHRAGDDTVVNVNDARGGPPQSLAFRLSREQVQLEKYLSKHDFGAIEIVDPASVTSKFLALLTSIDAPLKILAADTGLICRHSFAEPNGGLCAKLGGKTACVACRGEKDRDVAWSAIATDDIVLPCPEAAGFASFLADGFKALPKLRRPPTRPLGNPWHGAIGILAQGRTVDEFKVVERLLREPTLTKQSFVLIGESANDASLFASGQLFITGPVTMAEYPDVLRRYRIDRIFLPLRRALFGHPAALAASESELPQAYFDWTFGCRHVRPDDLAIDPRHDLDSAVRMIAQWGMQ